MQSSNIPAKFPIPFASAAGPSYIRTVPTASQIGITDGAASLTDGFPPLTFTPVASGGVPPFGQDVNGILNPLTAWARWLSAGGPVFYDPAFSTAIGGYPKGAIVASPVTDGLSWQSTTENNATNPDTGGAGWVRVPIRAATLAQMQAATSENVSATPKILKDAGFDRVVSQTFTGNSGTRRYASGRLESWGTTVVAINSSAPVTFPTAFASVPWVSCNQYVRNSTTDQENGGVLIGSVTTAGFTLVNGADFDCTYAWEARGAV